MPAVTLMRDNPETLQREAWQNGKMVFTWTKQEIEKMHKESATCPAWGCFPYRWPGVVRPNDLGNRLAATGRREGEDD